MKISHSCFLIFFPILKDLFISFLISFNYPSFASNLLSFLSLIPRLLLLRLASILLHRSSHRKDFTISWCYIREAGEYWTVNLSTSYADKRENTHKQNKKTQINTHKNKEEHTQINKHTNTKNTQICKEHARKQTQNTYVCVVFISNHGFFLSVVVLGISCIYTYNP